jgi:hypothetical protein
MESQKFCTLIPPFKAVILGIAKRRMGELLGEEIKPNARLWPNADMSGYDPKRTFTASENKRICN